MNEAVKIGDGENKALGRWRMNSGSEMSLTVPSLSKKPIRAVIDFSTAKFKKDKIVALHVHDDEKVVGFWDRGDISSRGIEADLHVIEPINEMEAAVLKEAVMVSAQARAGVPIQVSVGAEPGPEGFWEEVEAGKTVTVNGREYCGDGDGKLFILRGGEIFEGSIVTFGADSVTGRIAASKIPVKKETTMSDKLKALLGKHPEKHHGLVARCVAEEKDETFINDAVHAADLADKDSTITALQASIDALKAENEKLKADAKLPQEKKGGEAIAAKAGGSKEAVSFSGKKEEGDEPKTLTEAMNQAIEAGAKERGFALRAFVLKKFPKIERI